MHGSSWSGTNEEREASFLWFVPVSLFRCTWNLACLTEEVLPWGQVRHCINKIWHVSETKKKECLITLKWYSSHCLLAGSINLSRRTQDHTSVITYRQLVSKKPEANGSLKGFWTLWSSAWLNCWSFSLPHSVIPDGIFEKEKWTHSPPFPPSPSYLLKDLSGCFMWAIKYHVELLAFLHFLE